MALRYTATDDRVVNFEDLSTLKGGEDISVIKEKEKRSLSSSPRRRRSEEISLLEVIVVLVLMEVHKNQMRVGEGGWDKRVISSLLVVLIVRNFLFLILISCLLNRYKGEVGAPLGI